MQYIVPQQPLQALAIEILINNLGDEDVKGNTVEELQARKLKISNQFFANCKLGAEVGGDI